MQLPTLTGQQSGYLTNARRVVGADAGERLLALDTLESVAVGITHANNIIHTGSGQTQVEDVLRGFHFSLYCQFVTHRRPVHFQQYVGIIGVRIRLPDSTFAHLGPRAAVNVLEIHNIGG